MASAAFRLRPHSASAICTRKLMWKPDTTAACISPARVKAEYSVSSSPVLSPRVTAAAMGAAAGSKAA